MAEQLPEQLVAWACEFDTTAGGLGVGRSQGKGLKIAESLCKHQLLPICQYLTKHVVTQSRADHVRRTLRRAAANDEAYAASSKLRTATTAREKAEAERKALQDRILSLRHAVAAREEKRRQLMEDCETMAHDVALASTTASDAKRSLLQRKQKLHILQAYAKSTLSVIQVIKRYSEMAKTAAPRDILVQGGTAKRATNNHTTSAVDLIRIRDMCAKLEESIKASLSRQDMLSGLELAVETESVAQLAPEAVLQALMGQSRAERDALLSGDVRRAEEADPFGTNEACHAQWNVILQEEAGRHVARYEETKALTAEAEMNEKQIAELVKSLSSAPNAVSPETAEGKATMAGSKALLSNLQSIIASTKTDLATLQSLWHSAVQSHTRHDQLTKDLENRHFEAIRLQKACQSAQKGVTMRITEIQQYSAAKIPALEESVESLARRAVGRVVEECRGFEGCPGRQSAVAKVLSSSRLFTKNGIRTMVSLFRQSPDTTISRLAVMVDEDTINGIVHQLTLDVGQKAGSQVRTHLETINEPTDPAITSSQALADAIANLSSYAAKLNEAYKTEMLPRARMILTEADASIEIHRQVAQLRQDRERFREVMSNA